MIVPDRVTVCDKCFRASCWHGVFYCNDARNAGLVEMSPIELAKLDVEHSDWWITNEELAAADGDYQRAFATRKARI